MRKRICKVCGAEFEGKKEQRLCPECRAQALRDTVIRPRTCISCGAVFTGGPRARYCPKCRAERQKAQAREAQRRKAAGKVRQIGSTDICVVCGKEYIVNGSLQKYCPECAEEAVRANVLPKKRARASEHRDEFLARKKELAAESAVCAYCGKVYTPTGPTVTCSEACAKEYARIVYGIADYKRGRRKTPPSHERYDSGLPQSEIAGVTYHRTRRKWQVIHNGKYIGLFATREKAEAKKKELEHDG